MSLARFFTDEDVHGRVAVRLRSDGIDAVSTPEAGRRGHPDDAQLAWAPAEGRAVFTHNVGDFARLHRDVITRWEHHAGIIVSPRRPIGDTIRRLRTLAQALSAEDLRDRLEFLSNWPPS